MKDGEIVIKDDGGKKDEFRQEKNVVKYEF